VLRAAIAAAEAAEAHTPEQLPALAEAGVTDSGGEGICVILRGLAAALAGERPPPAVAVPDRPLATLAGHEHEEFGFCTEFVLEPAGGPLDVAAVRALALPHRSAVVVGDEAAMRVHLHCDDPEAVFEAAAALGTVSRAKADDMGAQHGRFRASGSGASERVALLALSTGAGFDAIFESLGAHVLHLGDIVKPAAGDIAAAANALGVPDVIVLPNHKNVVLAARQATGLARCTLSVVATESMPQGIAAAVAFDAGQPLSTTVEDMDEARHEVVTVEVTTASADRTADGLSVRAGDAIGLINGRLVARAGAPADALLAALNRIADDGGGLVTIYGGSEVDAAELERVRGAIAARFRDATVEAAAGGQTLYSFIASVER
jgi:dihydroxyacetone kinase-like predicted kinase